MAKYDSYQLHNQHPLSALQHLSSATFSRSTTPTFCTAALVLSYLFQKYNTHFLHCSTCPRLPFPEVQHPLSAVQHLSSATFSRSTTPTFCTAALVLSYLFQKYNTHFLHCSTCPQLPFPEVQHPLSALQHLSSATFPRSTTPNFCTAALVLSYLFQKYNTHFLHSSTCPQLPFPEAQHPLSALEHLSSATFPRSTTTPPSKRETTKKVESVCRTDFTQTLLIASRSQRDR